MPPPERILLQYGDIESDVIQPDYEGATWCVDQINDEDTKYLRADIHEREVAALTTHLEAEIDSHIASRKSLRERADALEAELDAAKSSVQSITQDYVGMCAVVRGLEAKVTEEMERVDQWKAKYEHQHGLHIAAKDELDAAKRALELLYDKWENGLACYEDGDPESGFVGNAFKLTEEEENQILALIPALPSAALAAKSNEQWHK